MSVAASNRVWNDSNEKGGRLLVLLALADFYNDEQDCAWPSVSRLASMTRFTQRHVSGVLVELEASGEIERAGSARRNIVRWRFKMEPKDCPNGKSKHSTPEKISGVKSDDVGEKFIGSPEKISGDPMKPSSDNPLRNIINPYGDDAGPRDKDAPADADEAVPANAHWNACFDDLRKRLVDHPKAHWLDGVIPESDDGKTLVLAVATTLTREIILKEFRADIETCLDRTLQVKVTVWCSQANNRLQK